MKATVEAQGWYAVFWVCILPASTLEVTGIIGTSRAVGV